MEYFPEALLVPEQFKSDETFHYPLTDAHHTQYKQKRYWSDLCEQYQIPGLAISTGISTEKEGISGKQKTSMISVGHTHQCADTGAERIDQHTVFEAGSLSKPVVSYLVFCLTKDGFFCPKKPLFQQLASQTQKNELLKELKDPLSRDRATRITAQMLLSHTAGFEGWRGHQPLAITCEPGCRFYYSGEGYLFLQRFLELRFEMSIETLFQQRIFPRLGMHRASFHCPEQSNFALALGHNRTGERLPKFRAPQAVIAGSLHTSLQDYAQFLLHLSQTANTPGGYFEWLQQYTVPTKTGGVQWGQGWGLLPSTNATESDLLWHWGDTGGYHAFVIIEPESGTFLNYFTNSQRGLSILKQALNHTKFPISQQQKAAIDSLINSVTNQKPGLERYWFDYNAQTPFYSLNYD